jgi:ESS family glutamate:Na+ symporter
MTDTAVILLLLVLGNAVAARSTWLRAVNIPGSFVAGATGSVLLLALGSFDLPRFEVPAAPRDLLLVLFFVAAGLSTTISSWVAAGKPLLLLSLLCLLMMVFQNVLGMGVAASLGAPLSYGVLGGSVAFAGGLGSAIAWGAEFGAKGIPNATEFAVIAATVGMTVGTFVGGPYVSWVVRRNRLPVSGASGVEGVRPTKPEVLFVEKHLVVGLLLFALAVVTGDVLRDALRAAGLITPRFLTAMMAGVVISALADVVRVRVDRALIEACGDVFLSVFIVMALCGIDLASLGRIAGPMALMAVVQTVGTVLFAHIFVFRRMGRDFEAATAAGGVIGFGLSSFAVAMATVKQVERNLGPAPRAVLLTTLVGGAVSNVANALVILAFYQWLVG